MLGELSFERLSYAFHHNRRGAGGTRTHNLRRMRPALYQLSYIAERRTLPAERVRLAVASWLALPDNQSRYRFVGEG